MLKKIEHPIFSPLQTLAYPTMNLLNILHEKWTCHSYSKSLQLMGRSLLMFCWNFCWCWCQLFPTQFQLFLTRSQLSLTQFQLLPLWFQLFLPPWIILTISSKSPLMVGLNHLHSMLWYMVWSQVSCHSPYFKADLLQCISDNSDHLWPFLFTEQLVLALTLALYSALCSITPPLLWLPSTYSIATPTLTITYSIYSVLTDYYK